MRKEPVMKKIRYVGLDVHAETISIAYAEEGREHPTYGGKIPNRQESIRTMMEKLSPIGTMLRACYEAGPTGYGLYWDLVKLASPVR